MRKLLILLLAVLLVATVFGDVEARAKYKTVPGLATTIAAGVIDTSSTISTSAWESVMPVVICECDSALVTIQTSVNGTTWVTLVSEQLDGTDGTTALQLQKTVTKVGTTASTFTEVVPLNYLRAIVNVNDSAANLSGLVFRLYYRD